MLMQVSTNTKQIQEPKDIIRKIYMFLNRVFIVPFAVKIVGNFDFDILRKINHQAQDINQTFTEIVESNLTKLKFQSIFDQNIQFSK